MGGSPQLFFQQPYRSIGFLKVAFLDWCPSLDTEAPCTLAVVILNRKYIQGGYILTSNEWKAEGSIPLVRAYTFFYEFLTLKNIIKETENLTCHVVYLVSYVFVITKISDLFSLSVVWEETLHIKIFWQYPEVIKVKYRSDLSGCYATWKGCCQFK